PCMHRPKKRPKDFDLHKGSEFKRAETKLREKHAAEKGWKQDVSNRPLSKQVRKQCFRERIGRAPFGAAGFSR
ncbi:MAG: hypothetical protein AAGU16_04255, partial [Desulfitobacterium hafniense]